MILKYTSNKIPDLFEKLSNVNEVDKLFQKINKFRGSSMWGGVEEGLNLENEEKAVNLSKKILKLTKETQKNCTYDKILKLLDSEIEPIEISKEEFISKFSETSSNTFYLVKDEEILDNELQAVGEFDIGGSKFKSHIGVVGKNLKLVNSSIELGTVEYNLLSGISSKGGSVVLNLFHSPHSVVVNNTLDTNDVGILISFVSNNSLVLGNALTKSRESAITIGQSQMVTTAGNTITNSNKGIESPYDARSVNLTINNKIMNNSVGIFSKSDLDLIIQNEITSNKKYGVSLNGYLMSPQKSSIVENKIISNGEAGVYGHYSDMILVKNNLFSKQNIGVFLNNSKHSQIENNQFVSNKKSGIKLSGECRLNVVKGNYIYDSQIGLELYSGYPHAYELDVIGNAFYKNKKSAIDNFHSHWSKFCGNVFKENDANFTFTEVNNTERCEIPNFYPQSEQEKLNIFVCEGIEIQMRQKPDSEIDKMIEKIKNKAGLKI